MSRARTQKPKPNRCVLVADRARARFFTIDSPEDVSGPVLVEHLDLVNPEGELTRAGNFSDRRGGRRNRSSIAGGGYAIDKRVERHEAEFDRRFARELAVRTRDVVKERRVGRLIVIAAPRFLGVLRSELASTLPEGVALSEIVADLTWHTPARIRAALVKHGMVRPSALPDVAYRPKAQHPSAKRGARSVQRRG